MAILRIYTDGACAGNQSDQNIGGWGAILEYGEHQKELFGGQANTTNNRMELTAVIEAFKALKQADQKIEVFTDSSYVANCFREEWYVSWEKNHWRNAAKKSVENQELWKELLALVRQHEVRFFRVKGSCQSCEQIDKFRRALRKIPRLERRCLQLRGIPICHQDEQPRRRAREHGHRADPSGGRYRDLI